MNLFFKNGAITRLLDIISKESEILIVTSLRGKAEIKDLFHKNKDLLASVVFYENFTSNPSIADLEIAIKSLNHNFKIIIGYGGGSSIDFAKCLKFFLNNKDFYNQNGILGCIKDAKSNKVKTNLSTKLVAIPTTSGTGSEATNFATIWDKNNKKKYSLLHDSIYPDYVIIDPELTLSLPLLETISTGLDAINQAFESLWNKNANASSRENAYNAISAGIISLPKLVQNSDDIHSRYEMSKCSHLAGKCINETRTAICHSISYPLTAHFDVPHGIACAFSMEAVLKLLKEKKSDLYNQMEQNIGVGNLISELKCLNEVTNFKSLVKEKVKKLSNLLDISDEMFTPGRADNFVLTTDKELINRIITESWKN